MQPRSSTPRAFRLGRWHVDVLAKRLVAIDSGARHVSLEPKAMHVLLVLVEHAGDVVDKEILFQAVWGRRPLTDDVLTVTVSVLRKALGDRARDPHFIQTVPGRGYRLIAEPRFVASLDREEGEPSFDSRRPWSHASTQRWIPWATGALLCALLFLIVPQHEKRSPLGFRPSKALTADVREARFWLATGNFEDARRARRLLDARLRQAPDDVVARAALAECLVHLSQVEPDSKATLNEARAHARTALALAPSATAYAALAYVQFALDLNVAQAEQTLRVALALDADTARAHLQLGILLTLLGRTEEGVLHLSRYAALDARAFAEPFLGLAHLASGDTDAAVHELESCVRAEPTDATARLFLARAYAAAGRARECWAAYDAYYAVAGIEGGARRALRTSYESAGLPGIQAFLLSRLHHLRAAGREVSPIDLAAQHAALGEVDEALAYLETGRDEGRTELLFLRGRREFDAIRAHPRFVSLLRSVGIAGPG